MIGAEPARHRPGTAAASSSEVLSGATVRDELAPHYAAKRAIADAESRAHPRSESGTGDTRKKLAIAEHVGSLIVANAYGHGKK